MQIELVYRDIHRCRGRQFEINQWTNDAVRDKIGYEVIYFESAVHDKVNPAQGGLTMKLLLREKLLSWTDRFTVWDEYGEERYFVEGELLPVK